MSSRTESYLSLWLEQASLSPLRFRHGCIIVQGGKLIGQGFNDHRAHFDGEAKRLASSGAYNSSAIIALSQKNRRTNKAFSGKYQQNEKSQETCSPCSDTNGGCLANASLLMHSETMAIYSALSLSGTLAP